MAVRTEPSGLRQPPRCAWAVWSLLWGLRIAGSVWQNLSRWMVLPGVCSLVGEQTPAKTFGCTQTLLELLPGPIWGPDFRAQGGMYSSGLARGCGIVRRGAPARKLLRCRSRRVAPALEGIKLWDMPHILLQDGLLFASKGKPRAFCAVPVTGHFRGCWSCFPVTPDCMEEPCLVLVGMRVAMLRGPGRERRGSHRLFLALLLRNVFKQTCRSPGR